MPKAVVFFDLDGTLLQDDKSVAAKSIQAIDQLQKKDIVPVIATGRNIFEIADILTQTKIDTVVSANGSYVQYQGRELAQEVIPQPLIEKFNAFAQENQDPVAWFNNESFGLSRETAATKENFHLLHLTPQVDPTWYQHHRVNFMFVFNENKEKSYTKAFADQLSLVRNNPRGLDTMKAGVSKATGIKTLLKAADLAQVPTFGFGDQLNDLPMLKLVNHPIVMGNGSAQVKPYAEYITASNMNGGIVQGLKHFQLI